MKRFSIGILLALAAFMGCFDYITDLDQEITLAEETVWVTVPGGTFTQTSFSHTISPFRISKYEVTYELWYAVRLWAVAHGYTFQNAGREGNDGTIGAAPTGAQFEPVTVVSWRDAIVWCNAYSEMAELTPCYTYGGSIIRDSRDSNAAACDGAVCSWAADGFRLPSEGEWQYAASYRDGLSWTPDTYSSGATANDEAATAPVAWYNNNSSSTTHIVGLRIANALGLFDMSGNVQEWCWDWNAAYPVSAQTNYRGPGSGTYREARGGSISSAYNGQVQVGYRAGAFLNPYNTSSSLGFRLARSL